MDETIRNAAVGPNGSTPPVGSVLSLTSKAHHQLLTTIIRAYPSAIVRLYCLIRFRIIRGRFLEEIAQFLPSKGKVLEVGCGFGLFGLYFARLFPEATITGVDLAEGRIQTAERARDVLGITNAQFKVGDARDVLLPDDLDAIYMLDILHHIPPDSAVRLLELCRDALPADGVLIIKDVDTRPVYKMLFTWILDVLMTGGERPDYWSKQDLSRQLSDLDFDVIRYAMVDLLPYPHMLYVCRPNGQVSTAGTSDGHD